MDELGYISQWRAIFAGGLAGIAAALATYPLEVAETRLITQNCREPTYFGVVHTLTKIYRSEGLLSLYRGFSLTVLGKHCILIHIQWVIDKCFTFLFLCITLLCTYFKLNSNV